MGLFESNGDLLLISDLVFALLKKIQWSGIVNGG
jgi:hypothetical protein